MNQQILSQEEVDALLQGIGGETAAAEVDEPADTGGGGGGVREYDPASQERRVRGRMPMLDIVGERFARNLRGGLFQLIRKTAEVASAGTKVVKFSAFLREIVVPTNFNVMQVKPLRGSALLVCDASLVFAVIDALFGGNGKFPARIEGREFSATELRVIRRLVDCICAELARAWEGIYPITLEYQRSEMQPQFVNIASPADMVVASSFSLEIGEAIGSVHICIPYATLEPIRELLYSAARGETAEHDRRWVEQLHHQLQSADLPLVAELATAQATVEQLLAFKPGDFVELDLLPKIQAKVDGVPVAECQYGTNNGRYAIKIDRMLTGHQAGWLGEHHV